MWRHVQTIPFNASLRLRNPLFEQRSIFVALKPAPTEKLESTNFASITVFFFYKLREQFSLLMPQNTSSLCYVVFRSISQLMPFPTLYILTDLKTIFKSLGLMNKYIRISSYTFSHPIPFSIKFLTKNSHIHRKMKTRTLSLKWSLLEQNPQVSNLNINGIKPQSLNQTYMWAKLSLKVPKQLGLQDMRT